MSRATADENASKHFFSAGVYDYLCGTVSGMGKVIAGYPFDTVKSRVQTGRFKNSVQAVWGTLTKEGVLAFYQGVTVPAITVCFVGGIMFYVNGMIRRWIQPDSNARLTYSEMLLAGSGAGFAVGMVLTPMEVMKVRLQVANRTMGEGVTLKAVVRKMKFKDFFAGSMPTLLREICTFGLFFPVNEYLKDVLGEWWKGDDDRRQDAALPLWIRVLAAGTGGVVGWFSCYPVDVIKSRMQVVPQGTYRGWLHCGQSLLAVEGPRSMYKGLAPCLMRAFPAYAAQFLLYEHARSFWK